VAAIVNLKSDIICLSDVRLSNKSNITCGDQVARHFETNPIEQYSMHYKSSQNKRGCAILLKKSLSFVVHDRREDLEENFLLLRISLAGTHFIIGSVYGPNNVNPEFFTRLKDGINSIGNYPVILVGDWNCTYSSDPILSNNDCINMTSVPNLRHSRLVDEMCVDLGFEDPFRALYPSKKEYTYIPRAGQKKNRSRIDFFLVSSSLLQNNFDCNIGESLLHSCFDHKNIELVFKRKINRNSNPQIFNSTIDVPESEICVWTTVVEQYLIHADINNLEGGIRSQQEHLGRIGRAKKAFRDAGPPLFLRSPENITEEIVQERSRILTGIEETKYFFINSGIFNISLAVDPDIFLEILIISVRNEVLNYQTFLKKTGNIFKDELLNSMKNLKNNYAENILQIATIEKRLALINESELRSKIENLSQFEILNGERMTPFFLNLFRGKKKEVTLAGILDKHGNEFESDAKRHESIVEYFEDVYKPPNNMPLNFDGCVDEFLGDFAAHPLVNACKLSDPEKNMLELPLEITELDRAVLEGKNNTAGGPDGFNNKFLKKFWVFFRVPLHKYALHCFNRGELSQTLKNANIKLIPKKGNCTQIKEWRPISLLPCIYKVISRAVYNRVKKYTDRFTSRAQKGFTKNRYIQEVLLNVMQNIFYCKTENISGAIVSVDFQKAFDTIYHGFIRECYKFFGMGEIMLKIFDTLGTNRTACIMLDNGRISRRFVLGTGRPQGEILSPVQFNVGEQILLLRIELDPAVASVYQHMLVPRNNFAIDPELLPLDYRFESSAETNKTDCFADDGNVTTLLNTGSIGALKNILDGFGLMSGLICNFEKSFILPTNPHIDNELLTEIENIGLPVSNKIKLLGFNITSDGINVREYFDGLYEKILGIIAFWQRFRLSLQGRLNVFKTLILCQINYGGCFLDFGEADVDRLQTICNGFVLSNIRLSKEKLYADPESGGIGLINIKDYLCAQRAVWIGRVFRSTGDCWRVDLSSLCSGNPFVVTDSCNYFNELPTLKPIASSFSKFRKNFYEKNDNYLSSYVINNDMIKCGENYNRCIDFEFFAQNRPLLDNSKLAKLKVKDCLADGIFKTRAALNADTQCEFNMVSYFRLRTAILQFLRNFKTKNSDGTSIGLDDFFAREKKGSRHLRKIIWTERLSDEKIVGHTTVKTYFRLTGFEIPDPVVLKQILPLWKRRHIGCDFGDFIFKLHSNSLGLNYRVANFIDNVSAACTFCILSGVNPPPRESFDHLFFYCEYTTRVTNFLLSRTFNNSLDDDDKKKRFVLTGFFDTGMEKIWNEFTGCVSLNILFIIWRCKLAKTLKANSLILQDFLHAIKTSLKISPHLVSKMNELELKTGAQCIFSR
jgi:exonuclease III